MELAESSSVITPSEPMEGFEGAGMGRIVHLKTPLDLSQVVQMIKGHLDLKHGMYAKVTNHSI